MKRGIHGTSALPALLTHAPLSPNYIGAILKELRVVRIHERPMPDAYPKLARNRDSSAL